MTYIELINRFWNLNDNQSSFTPSDAMLYFRLLYIANALYWTNPFYRSERHLALELNLSTNTIREARNRLKQRNLIDFETPKKRSKGFEGQTKYFICDAPTASNFEAVTEAVTAAVTEAVPAAVTEAVPAAVTAAQIKTKIKIEDKDKKEKKILKKNVSDFSDFSNFEEIVSASDFCQQYAHHSWLEQVAMKAGCSEIEIKCLFSTFCDIQELSDSAKSIKEFKSHFINWLRAEKKKEKSCAKKENGQSKLEQTADCAQQVFKNLGIQ